MIAVTGAGGQLGQAVLQEASKRGIEAKGFSRQELDASDASAVKSAFAGAQFDCIVNCAAYTAVDKAESEPAQAFLGNAFAPWLLGRTGIPVLHVSTDYVFDGKGTRPYLESDAVRPLSVYGLSKRAGETALLESGASGAIVRTAWLYSKAQGTKNFYQTMLRLGQSHDEISVVADQFGAPTLVDDLAGGLLDLYQAGGHQQPMQLFQFVNSGKCSWADFAEAIMSAAGLHCRVKRIASSEWPSPVTRPSYSVLSTEKFTSVTGKVPRSWQDALLS
ncbi:MAG: dTDP-4-dehydrorhamnose reductase [Burkholderia sp.]|jgi:dTDP-4-dehydrorhamnose reductase